MRHRFVRALHAATLLTGLGVLVLASRSHEARAGWPPAPGADMKDKKNWPSDPGYASQWNYWSWLPDQMKGTAAYNAADVKLGASGMSVDRAWTFTLGRPDVKIAVLDSGIQWEESDLVNKAFLNAAELTGAKRPTDKNGAACGGVGALAGYDCDGDGAFSVADYRDDPRMSPIVVGDKCFTDGDRTQKGPDRIKGDVNHNCVLDPGDLIEMFSDGVDDDANGYTDDISGWDFFKNDNNPYDDTRYGHGSGEAKDSSAEGNNALGSLGVCPLCRFVPLRVGESYIGEGNDFAKAVVYATDTGIKVIGEALGGVNLNSYGRQAIDYAYAHGTVIIGSMADENSRHRMLPAATNHTLQVHAITYDGSDFSSSTSFLAFNRCTNFGGHNMLSLSGRNCSSEATGRGAGVAGLIYSLAASRSQPLNLSAEEVMQIFKMTADDIDIPESRSDDPELANKFYESRPGWDQRFGYGRVNVARAMQAVKDGLIPPEVDIVSPAWYDVLYDKEPGLVPIVGRIAASRATSYDYAVEWAAGVEPDDAAFKPLITEVRNVPAATVTGGGAAPLALIDPKSIDTKHVADPDSPHHENDRTITVRVRALAHYGDVTVRGEARRTLAVVNKANGGDADLLPGFPIKLGGSIESSPKLADIDNDGLRDVVIGASDGNLHVYSLKTGSPVELPGFPYRTNVIDGLNPTLTDPAVPSYLNAAAYKSGKSGGVDADLARETIVGTPGVADLDGDGKLEIVFTTWHGTTYVVDSKGQPALGWPRRLPLVPSCPLDPSKPTPATCMDAKHAFARGAVAAPVLVDMDKDGKLEIVQAAFDGQIHVFKLDGTELDGFPVLIHSPKTDKYNRIISTPAVADFNGDGIPDMATGSNEEIGGGANAGPVFLVDGRGMKTPGGPYFPNWPVTITSLHLIPVIAEGVGPSPAAADFDGDGKLDVVVQGTGGFYVLPADPGKQGGFGDPPNILPLVTQADGTEKRGFDPSSIFGEYSKADRPDTFFPALSHPSVGDLDQDGVPDLIMSGDSLSFAGSIIAGAGNRVPLQHLLAMYSGKTGHMFPGAPVVTEDVTFLMNSSVADLSGDDYPEVIVGTGGYFLHAADACGNEPEGWPKFTNSWLMSTAAVGDLDGDQKLEAVTATRDGYVYAWKTKGSTNGVVQWESFHHDNRNTGDYSRKLDQGVLRRASKPLVCTPPAKAGAGNYDAGGCAVAPGIDRGGRGALGAFGVALGWLAARARRKRRPAA